MNLKLKEDILIPKALLSEFNTAKSTPILITIHMLLYIVVVTLRNLDIFKLKVKVHKGLPHFLNKFVTQNHCLKINGFSLTIAIGSRLTSPKCDKPMTFEEFFWTICSRSTMRIFIEIVKKIIQKSYLQT